MPPNEQLRENAGPHAASQGETLVRRKIVIVLILQDVEDIFGEPIFLSA